MKLQNIPILAAVLLWSLSLPVLAHGGGGGGHGGGGHGGGGGGRGGGMGFRGGPRGSNFVVGTPRASGASNFVVGVPRASGASNFVVGVPRASGAWGRNCGYNGCGYPGGRFGPHGRFDHRGRFNRNDGFNNVYVSGGGYGGFAGYPYYPYGYPTYPNSTLNQYPSSYYYSNLAPVAAYDPAPAGVGGDVVSNVQRALRSRRFYFGPIDGVSGPATRAAIRAYDSAAGLPVTGVIDANLLASLRLM